MRNWRHRGWNAGKLSGIKPSVHLPPIILDWFAARGYAVSARIDGPAAAALVCLPRAKAEARALLADGLTHLLQLPHRKRLQQVPLTLYRR